MINHVGLACIYIESSFVREMVYGFVYMKRLSQLLVNFRNIAILSWFSTWLRIKIYIVIVSLGMVVCYLLGKFSRQRWLNSTNHPPHCLIFLARAARKAREHFWSSQKNFYPKKWCKQMAPIQYWRFENSISDPIRRVTAQRDQE